jgi:type VI secretion system protein ImpL
MTALMTNPVAFIGIPAVLVSGTVAGLAWWRQKKATNTSKPAEPAQDAPPVAAPAVDLSQLHALFHDAKNKLKLSPRMKGESFSALPVILVVGPAGSGMTTAILRSGLDPELLAGQVYQGSNVSTTRTLNIWLARQTIFIEISAAVASDAIAVKAIFKHLTPGRMASGFRRTQPPRGILLCVDQSPVGSAATPDEISALARPWNQLVSLIAGALGVQLPTYVLFTKSDGLVGFQEFFDNLTSKDLAQAVGATIRPFTPGSQGVYADDTSRLLTQHFLDIVHCLCDCRLPLLNREPDRARVALEYQFPRDFSKLQKNVVQFLVEIARPSQLQVSPFLRGFYFSGTRKVIVDTAESSVAPATAIPETADFSATRVINPEQIRAQMSAARSAPTPRGQREITEWLFLTSLFDGVILRDRSAHGVSATNTRTDRVRAAVFAVIGLLGIALLVAFTIAYVKNRSLEKAIETALTDSGSTSIYVRLDNMRSPIEQLIRYPSGRTSMKWGLYQGEKMLTPAGVGYCAEIGRQVLPQLLQRMRNRLQSMHGVDNDYFGDFDNLKAYMMMTSDPQRADQTFLESELFGVWKEVSSRDATPEATKLLPAELRLYGALLRIPDVQSYCVDPSRAVIPAAQEYLRNQNQDNRYRSLLHQAGKDLDDVNYDKSFPNDAVSDGVIVPGWFTRRGWAEMQRLLGQPDSLKADAWVLGGASTEPTPQELSDLVNQYRTRYSREYVQVWKDFLDKAGVKTYANLNDAAAKLDNIASSRSSLLKLIDLVRDHTSSLQSVNAIFQPVSAVVPEAGNYQPAAKYLEQLNSLKNLLLRAAQSTGPAYDQVEPEVEGAVTAAQNTVDNIALTFKGQLETDQEIKAILLRPIIQVPPLLQKKGDEALNAGGKDLCHEFHSVEALLPFFAASGSGKNAPVDKVQQIFQPSGDMLKFYKDSLHDSLNCSGATCTKRVNAKVSNDTVEYFTALFRWNSLLYGDNSDSEPIVRIQARMQPYNNVKAIEVLADDHSVLLSANQFQTIVWKPRRNQSLQINVTFQGESVSRLFEAAGTWALFDWIFNAEPNPKGSDVYRWVNKEGRVSEKPINGHSPEYRIELQTGDGAALDLYVRPCPFH